MPSTNIEDEETTQFDKQNLTIEILFVNVMVFSDSRPAEGGGGGAGGAEPPPPPTHTHALLEII